MQLSQQLKVRQSQSLVMTPQLQQAIKLLQMTNLELCQYLENQQLENPFLENDKNELENQNSVIKTKNLLLKLLQISVKEKLTLKKIIQIMIMKIDLMPN